VKFADICGIVGAIMHHNVSAILLDALQRLEYRGYDYFPSMFKVNLKRIWSAEYWRMVFYEYVVSAAIMSVTLRLVVNAVVFAQVAVPGDWRTR
jgi:hypothetical protein